MKKIASLVLITILLTGGLFLFTGCGEKENAGTSTDDNKVQSNNDSSEHLWNDSEYSKYTNGVYKPNFDCEVIGDITILGMKFKAINVTDTNIEEWKQALLNNGFALAWEDEDGSWEVVSSTHTVLYTAMNYYFYIDAK